MISFQNSYFTMFLNLGRKTFKVTENETMKYEVNVLSDFKHRSVHSAITLTTAIVYDVRWLFYISCT